VDTDPQAAEPAEQEEDTEDLEE
jgi:hypothetical protein